MFDSSGFTLPDTSAPPREIELSSEHEEAVQQAIAELEVSGLDIQIVFDVFMEWQSKRTVAIKKIFASSSVIIAAVTWIGVSLTDISFLGFKVGEGSLTRFDLFLLVIVLLSGSGYWFSRNIDLAVKKARISRIERQLVSCQTSTQAIDDVVAKYSLPSAHVLFNDFKRPFIVNNSADQAYDAVSFYSQHLLKASNGTRLIEKIEIIGLYSLAAYAVYELSVIFVHSWGN